MKSLREEEGEKTAYAKWEGGVKVGMGKWCLLGFKVGTKQQCFIRRSAPSTVPARQAPD